MKNEKQRKFVDWGQLLPYDWGQAEKGPNWRPLTIQKEQMI